MKTTVNFTKEEECNKQNYAHGSLWVDKHDNIYYLASVTNKSSRFDDPRVHYWVAVSIQAIYEESNEWMNRTWASLREDPRDAVKDLRPFYGEVTIKSTRE